VYELAGGSINHGLLCGNIYSEIRNGLNTKNNGCKTLNSELKLYISIKNSFVHPDAMVVCDKIKASESDKNSITNPTLIVEVLSNSTALYDRSDKFFLYRQIPSFKEYVLIEQDKYLVEVYYKPTSDDLWNISRFEGIDQIIHLQSINLKINMTDLYFDVNL